VRSASLAEKFFLVVEALIKSSQYPDGSPRQTSTSHHIPVELPVIRDDRVDTATRFRED
jgi:hypothetical protein